MLTGRAWPILLRRQGLLAVRCTSSIDAKQFYTLAGCAQARAASSAQPTANQPRETQAPRWAQRPGELRQVQTGHGRASAMATATTTSTAIAAASVHSVLGAGARRMMHLQAAWRAAATTAAPQSRASLTTLLPRMDVASSMDSGASLRWAAAGRTSVAVMPIASQSTSAPTQPAQDESSLQSPPNYCCMSGCANCVWDHYLDSGASTSSDSTQQQSSLTDRIVEHGLPGSATAAAVEQSQPGSATSDAAAATPPAPSPPPLRPEVDAGMKAFLELQKRLQAQQ